MPAHGSSIDSRMHAATKSPSGHVLRRQGGTGPPSTRPHTPPGSRRSATSYARELCELQPPPLPPPGSRLYCCHQPLIALIIQNPRAHRPKVTQSHSPPSEANSRIPVSPTTVLLPNRSRRSRQTKLLDLVQFFWANLVYLHGRNPFLSLLNSLMIQPLYKIGYKT